MKKVFFSCIAALFFIGVFAQDMPVNPFIRIDSTEYPASENIRLYTADPSAHVWNIDGEDVLYVYPSHDTEPADYGCDMMDNYHVFSTKDMVNWTDHGKIFGAADVPWGHQVKNGGRNASFMWAPDCVEKDGKYYYYFPHPYGYADRDGWDNWRIGIAISDYPDKDFKVLDTFLLGLPDTVRTTPHIRKGKIDPQVFIDDDGQAYFYYGGDHEPPYVAKLKENMIEIESNTFQEISGLPYFHEGVWVFKRNGIYYLTYPGNDVSLPNYLAGQDQLLYAVSDNPLGPWTYKGSYLAPEGSDTSHGSVVEFNGQWYAFYHNNALSGRGNLRSICVDKLFFDGDDIRPVVQTGEDRNIDGKDLPAIIQAENFKNGGEGIGFHENTDTNTGGSYYRLGLSKSVDLASSGASAAEGLYLTDLESGEWFAYDVNVSATDTFIMEVRISSTVAGKFHLENEAGETIIEVDVPNTGGLNTWQSVLVRDIILPAGNQTLKFVIDNGGFNFNYFMLTLQGEVPVGKIIAFGQNGKYVTLVGTQLRCTKNVMSVSQFSDTEKFLVVDAGNGLVALKNISNNRYIRTNTDNMACNSSSISDVNKFFWCILKKDGNDKRIALKSLSNNKIVYVYDNDANKPLRAVSDNLASWETFTWQDLTPKEPNEIADVNIDDSKVSLYPNPAKNTVIVSIENGGNADISISDLNGKILYNTAVYGNTAIDVSGFPSGLYLLYVVSDELNVVKKLVVS